VKDLAIECSPSQSTKVSTRDSATLDVNKREDVQKLKPHAVGLLGVLFMAMAGSAPLTAMLGNVPFAVGSGNGSAAPGGFIFAGVIIVLFSVGYVTMVRRFTTAGGFYTFISHGLGRVFGMGAGWAGMGAYAIFEASLMGIFAFYARNTFATFFGVHWAWPIFAFAAIILIGALTYFDVRLSARVLGILTACEVVLLVLMDIFVFAKGGGPSGISAAPLNPIQSFSGANIAVAAPGVGIFFAFWSWVGFESSANYAEESKNPKRTVSWAVYILAAGLCIFYTWTAWAVILGHGLSQSVKAAATNPVTFFYSVTAHFVSPVAKDAMEWLIMTSSFACGMAFHNAATRYFYSMGREQVLHRQLGRTHHRWQSPHIGSLFQSAIAAVLVGLFLLLWFTNGATEKFATFQNAPYDELYAWLAILGTFWIMVLMIGSSLGTVSYFARHRSEESVLRWLVAPVLGAAGMIYAVYLLWVNVATLGGNIVFVKAIPYIGVGWLLVGFAIALVIRRRNPKKYETLGRLVNEGV
jgi:amino acid transporter